MSLNNVRKSIGWADFTVNPVKGLCPVDCKNNQGKSYCYARKIYKRFGMDETIRYDNDPYLSLNLANLKPSRIFVGSTIELFGEWVKPEWMNCILEHCKHNPQHTFIFLTKKPENLYKWSPFPPNVWVGASATSYKMFAYALEHLSGIEANVRFISIEPMLDRMNIPLLEDVLNNCGINWVIIGQQTPVSKKTMSRIEWVKEIVNACDTAGIPVFLKNNLKEMFWQDAIKQENMPNFMIPKWAGKQISPHKRGLRQDFPGESK